jgi:ABC-type transport system involved in Fe-S cluster assembly fused permease/ATPase subunit
MYFDVFVALAAITAAIFYTFVTVRISKWRIPYTKDARTKRIEESIFMEDSFSNHETVKVFY